MQLHDLHQRMADLGSLATSSASLRQQVEQLHADFKDNPTRQSPPPPYPSVDAPSTFEFCMVRRLIDVRSVKVVQYRMPARNLGHETSEVSMMLQLTGEGRCYM